MDKLTRTGKSGTNTNRSEGTHALLKNGQTTLKESSAKDSTYCVRCPRTNPGHRKEYKRVNGPYTLAVHRGQGENPHAHLMISERANDGIERSREQWFKRYNSKDPEKGRAQTSERWSGRWSASALASPGFQKLAAYVRARLERSRGRSGPDRGWSR